MSQGNAGIEPNAPLSSSDQVGVGIPPILFQTWKVRSDLPEYFAVARKTLLDLNVEFSFPLWDDADNRNFIERHFPWFLPTYDAYPREIYRADAVRYFFLYAFGGVYADLDVVGLRSLQSLVGSPHVVLGRMGFDRDFRHAIPNAAMASAPRQPFWLYVISLMMELSEKALKLEPEFVTGPVVLKRAVDDFESDQGRIREIAALLPEGLQPVAPAALQLLEPHVWFPMNWNDPVHRHLRDMYVAQGAMPTYADIQKMFPESTLATFWTQSWGTDPAPLNA